VHIDQVQFEKTNQRTSVILSESKGKMLPVEQWPHAEVFQCKGQNVDAMQKTSAGGTDAMNGCLMQKQWFVTSQSCKSNCMQMRGKWAADPCL
jgi:hypothetical protein